MGRRRGMKWTQSWSKSLQNVCKLLCKFMIKQNLVSFFVKYLEEVKVQYLRKQKTHSNIKMQLVRWVIHFPVNPHREDSLFCNASLHNHRETHRVPMSSWPGSDNRHLPLSPLVWPLPGVPSQGAMTALITHHSPHVTLIASSSQGRQSTNRSGDKKIWTDFVFTCFCLLTLSDPASVKVDKKPIEMNACLLYLQSQEVKKEV